MSLLADLASWSVRASFCIMSRRETVEAKPTGCYFLDSRVDFQVYKLMAFFCLMHSTADVAAVRRLRLLLAIGQGIAI